MFQLIPYSFATDTKYSDCNKKSENWRIFGSKCTTPRSTVPPPIQLQLPAQLTPHHLYVAMVEEGGSTHGAVAPEKHYNSHN